MSAMVERVARAICEASRMNPDDALGGWVHWQEEARAAIGAIREPTQEMLAAANRINHARDIEIWYAMVDASLQS